jgi:hypothetical protein
MTSKFYPKAALFESKSQVMGNWIVFHRKLSDAAKILIFALNGIFTCTHTWVPIQCDLQKRLGWGKEKMRNTIKECESAGFLRVTQRRHKSGEFACNDFEFCIDASFKEKSINSSQEKPAHNESEPETDLRCPDSSGSVNQLLPCSLLEQPCLKEQQTEQVLPEAVVVVSLEKEKRQLLQEFDFPEKLIHEFITYDFEHLQNAIESLKRAQNTSHVPNPQGFLVIAIRQGWKPSKTKSDIEQEKDLEEKQNLKEIVAKKNAAFRLLDLHKDFFTQDYFFTITDSIQLKTQKGFAIIHFQDDDCLKLLAKYIELKGKM